MIRRMVCASLGLALAGCAALESRSGGVTYVAMPLIGQTYDRDVYNREGTSFYNPRWSFDPDSHPAVRPSGAANGPYPPVSTRSAPEQRAEGQLTGGIAGALIGAQAGNRTAGIVAGSAIGAFAGGKLADPCSPGAKLGTLWGGLVGGWFGSLFGAGRGRDFWAALGAAGGAVRGTDMGADGRRCR
jgi:outer membrane lipoprotein SlyB